MIIREHHIGCLVSGVTVVHCSLQAGEQMVVCDFLFRLMGRWTMDSGVLWGGGGGFGCGLL